MLNRQALVALAACIAALPVTFAAEPKSTKPPLGLCKEGKCDDKDDGCPAQITTSGGYPTCKIYNTEDVLNVGDFEAAEGGGTAVFLDIFEPDEGCSVIVRSPASTDEPGCGFVVGAFKNAACSAISLKETFIIQHCCGSADCEKTGAAKMIRGIDYKQSLPTNDMNVTKSDGTVVEPAQVGEPPAKRTLPQNDAPKLLRRDDYKDKNCKKQSYVQDGEVYTRPALDTQIVATGVDGGSGGGEVTITQERTVSQSISFTAGVNIEIIEASTTLTYEESITNGKEKKWTIPAGMSGKVGFTPNLKCSKGSMECGDGTSTGEACTGYEEAGEIAGTYAVIALD